jgi:site-specific DNA-cytosine methylase
MGLPDDWLKYGIDEKGQFEVSDSQKYKLAGNGVVVNVVEEIIKNLIC